MLVIISKYSEWASHNIFRFYAQSRKNVTQSEMNEWTNMHARWIAVKWGLKAGKNRIYLNTFYDVVFGHGSSNKLYH